MVLILTFFVVLMMSSWYENKVLSIRSIYNIFSVNFSCDLAPKKKDIDEYFSESKNLLRFKEQVERAKQRKVKKLKDTEEQQTSK